MTTTLDPQARELLDHIDEVGMPPSSALSVEGARRRPQVYPEIFGSDSDPDSVGSVRDLLIDGPGGDLPVRVYEPDEDGPHPVLVYLHGGGWVLGNLEARDDFCRAWASRVGHVVVNVDYRLAPEHPFPAPLEDAYAATEWAAERAALFEGDPQRVVVAGDSAGGNLAAGTALLARDRDGPELAHQLLVYPITNYGFDTDSYREYAEGHFLTRENMRWYWNHYLRSDVDAVNPYASPLRTPDLEGLAPATVLTCECDPLRDEGAAYADRLAAAGVPTTHLEREAMIHGFQTFFHRLDAASEALDEMADAVESSLES